MSSTFFDDARLSLGQSIDLTIESLRSYGSRYSTWAIAYSGGKDSTTLVTLTVWLIEQGLIPKPERLYVLYGDTRMELPPLSIAAYEMMTQLGRRDWIEPRVVVAPLDQRFFVYMLGRGVPPPNNNTLRWCTAQIKVEPMEAELRRLTASSPEKLLMLIGVRIGESAVRDQRIALACSRNGAECGQGWYQRDLPDAICDKLSPILHWRTCLVWDWLAGREPFINPDLASKRSRRADEPIQDWAERMRGGLQELHGFPTRVVAEAYGLDADDSLAESNARTGCVGCPLASHDTALEGLLKNPAWAYLRRLRPIYRKLRESRNRLRQPGGERRKDGTLIENQNRMGPLTMDARLWAHEEILSIQTECNVLASREGRPAIDILNIEEQRRIRELIEINQLPNGCTGNEPVGDLPYEDVYADGSRQLLLPTVKGAPLT